MVSMYSTTYVDDIREIKEENPFESMMSRFDRAAQLLDLDPDLYAVLRVPNRELKVYIPTKMDSGRIQVFEGFRVQHNFARGPAKGGIRYAPDVNIDERGSAPSLMCHLEAPRAASSAIRSRCRPARSNA